MTDPTPQPLDEIQVLGIELRARHGVFDDERADGRDFRVDVIARVGQRLRGFQSDRIGDTVDYTRIAQLVHDVMTGPPCHLVERLAERIAQGCLAIGPVVEVEVTIHKRATGVAGDPRWVGVHIVRR